MTQQELIALIQRARTGEPQAQETLIQEIQNRVYYHCKKMLKNESDAQDATQDVLITVLTSLDKLREPAAFYGWVNGITANRCRHLLTQGVREWQIPENEDGGSMLDDLEELDQQAVPDAVLDNKETQRLMMELIDALPPEQRMSILFYYYDEMSVKEIAEAMETSEGTVKSRLNYARKSIKAGVEDLEKRGTKLYGIAPLPLLLLFLRREAAQSSMSAVQSSRVTSAVLSAVRTGAAQTGAGVAAAGTAAKTAAGAVAKAGMGLGTKIAVGVLAAAVAVSAVVGGIYLANREEEPPEEEEPPAQVEQLPEEEPEDEGPSPELLALLDQIVYYGDKEQCQLTPEQASAFAAVIRQGMADVQARADQSSSEDETVMDFRAAFFDSGNGVPALFFGGGVNYNYDWAPPYDPDGEIGGWEGNMGTYGIWQIQDGQAVPYTPEGEELSGFWQWGELTYLRDDSLFIGGNRGSDGTTYRGGVYPLTSDGVATIPQTTATYQADLENPDFSRCTIDGVEVTRGEFEAWVEQWEKQTVLCGQRWSGSSSSLSGMGKAATAADALEQYAGGTQAPGVNPDEFGIGDILDAFGPSDLADAYGPAYAQKVRELLENDPSMTFNLVYIDRDDIPELLVSRLDYDLDSVSLYTFDGEQLHTLFEDRIVGIRDYLGYYPRENLVESSCADLAMNRWSSSSDYYRISIVHEWEATSEPDDSLGEIQYLSGSMTGEEILAQLES